MTAATAAQMPASSPDASPFARHLATPHAATLIENVIDAGHVPFTHHASVSRRESSSDFAGQELPERHPCSCTGVTLEAAHQLQEFEACQDAGPSTRTRLR